MNLGFSREININMIKVQSFFKEKILACFGLKMAFVDQVFVPKKHTIRDDLKERWRVGMLIHFVYEGRSKKRECFHIGKCTGSEYIAITYPPCCGFTVYVFYDDKSYGVKLTDDQIKELAINDGFDSVEDFKGYFDKPFFGRIIHWTDVRYGR